MFQKQSYCKIPKGPFIGFLLLFARSKYEIETYQFLCHLKSF
jgi:hypothetical protein